MENLDALLQALKEEGVVVDPKVREQQKAARRGGPLFTPETLAELYSVQR